MVMLMFNLKQLLKKVWANKFFDTIITFASVVVVVWLFSAGRRYGFIGFLVASVLIAVLRVARGWKQYSFVTSMGAEQLRLYTQSKKDRKKEKRGV